MMKKTKIGRKLSIFTAIEACHAIRRVHNPDLEVRIYFDLIFYAIIIFWRGSGYSLKVIVNWSGIAQSVSFKKCVTEKRTYVNK